MVHTVAPVISKSSCWKQTAPKLHKKGVNATGRLKVLRWNTRMHLPPAAEVADAPMILQGDDTLGKWRCSLSCKPGWNSPFHTMSYTGVGQGSQKGTRLVTGQRERGRLESVVMWRPGVCRTPCSHKSLLLNSQVVFRGGFFPFGPFKGSNQWKGEQLREEVLLCF